MSSKSDDNPSTELNDQEFNEYLRRGSGISQQYADLPSRDVPTLLEQRILQQARTARPARKAATPRWVQWGAPLAVAASMLLAVTVLLRSTPEDRALQMPATPLAADEPPVVESEEALAPASSERSKMASEQPRDAAPERDRKSTQAGPADAGSARPLAAAPPVPTSAPPPRANAYSPQSARQRRARNDDETKVSAPAPASPAGEARESNPPAEKSSYAAADRAEVEVQRTAAPPAAKREQRVPAEQPFTGIVSATSMPAPLPPDPQVLADRKVAPEYLLEQLRALRAQGKTEEANALLERLRAAHPEFQVPVEDQPPP